MERKKTHSIKHTFYFNLKILRDVPTSESTNFFVSTVNKLQATLQVQIIKHTFGKGFCVTLCGVAFQSFAAQCLVIQNHLRGGD